MRRLILTASLAVGVSAALAGAAVWETKPFMTWTDKELQQVLTDSPWSKTIEVVMNTVGRGGGAGESESAGGGRRGGGGGDDAEAGGGGGSRGGGGGRSGGFPTGTLEPLRTRNLTRKVKF